MAVPAHVVSRLEFVEQPEGEAFTVWRDPDAMSDEAKEYKLDRSELVRYGLVDRLRRAIHDEVERRGRPAYASEATDGASSPSDTDLKAEVPRDGVTVAGGESVGWRWARVEDGEHVLWAIDNRPQVEKAKEDGDSLLEFQHVIVPDVVIRAIRSTSS